MCVNLESGIIWASTSLLKIQTGAFFFTGLNLTSMYTNKDYKKMETISLDLTYVWFFSTISFHENIETSLKVELWRIIFQAMTPWSCKLHIWKIISHNSRTIYQMPTLAIAILGFYMYEWVYACMIYSLCFIHKTQTWINHDIPP